MKASDFIKALMIGLPLCILIILAEKYVPPSYEVILIANWPILKKFGAAFCITALITSLLYYKSLGALFEDETPLTIKVQRLNIAIWICFWLSWAFYCASMVSDRPDLPSYIIGTSLAICPGILTSLLTLPIRKEEIHQNNEIKEASLKYNSPYEPSTLNTKYTGYVGFYGLICIPCYPLCLWFISICPKHVESLF